MLVCIPTNGNAGLDDTVSEHFGSARYFTLYDSETGKVEILENHNVHHAHGTCHPLNQLGRYCLGGIVCSGMGRRAIEALSTEGIKVYQADTEEVSGLVEKLKTGSLNEIDPAKACRGHGQHQTDTAGPRLGSQQSRGRGQGQGRGTGRLSGQSRGRRGNGNSNNEL